jgi:hypothetical protein
VTGLPIAPLSGILGFQLGPDSFFAHHGRAYRTSALDLKDRTALRELCISLLNTRPDRLPADYPLQLAQLRRRLERHVRPAGKWKRLRAVLRRLRLLPNPFARATEKELLGISIFVLGERPGSIGHPERTAL